MGGTLTLVTLPRTYHTALTNSALATKPTSFLKLVVKVRMIYDATPWSLVSSYKVVSNIFITVTITLVLLRVLEYYDGILILTTNRMKSFAFGSRDGADEVVQAGFEEPGGDLQEDYEKDSPKTSL